MTALDSYLDKWESRTKAGIHAKLYKRSQLKKLIKACEKHDVTYAEIAKSFGVTGGRVSQVYHDYLNYAKKR